MSLTLYCELMFESSMTLEGYTMENTERKASEYLFIPRTWVSGELSLYRDSETVVSSEPSEISQEGAYKKARHGEREPKIRTGHAHTD